MMDLDALSSKDAMVRWNGTWRITRSAQTVNREHPRWDVRRTRSTLARNRSEPRVARFDVRGVQQPRARATREPRHAAAATSSGHQPRAL